MTRRLLVLTSTSATRRGYEVPGDPGRRTGADGIARRGEPWRLGFRSPIRSFRRLSTAASRGGRAPGEGNGRLGQNGRFQRDGLTIGLAAWLVILAALASVAIGSPVSAASPAQTAPTASITPDADLGDGQVVTVDAAGFTPGVPVYAAQCGMPLAGLVGCQNRSGASADADDTGAATTSLGLDATVWVSILLGSTAVDCRVADHCFVAVGTDPNRLATDGVRVPLPFVPGSPDAPATITTVPAIDLLDAQTVTVSGAGLLPGAASVEQCSAALTACRPVPVTAAADGTFTVDYRLDAILTSTDDCRAQACVLRVPNPDPTEPSPTFDLAFDPDGELEPPPPLILSPAADLEHGQTVGVSGAGFDPGELVHVYQCPTGDAGLGCTRLASQTIGADGQLGQDLTVTWLLHTIHARETDCRPAGACSIVASSSGVESSRARHAVLAFDPAGPFPPPTITLDPATGIDDLDAVTITGADFPLHTRLHLALCHATDLARCDTANDQVETTGDGTIELSGGRPVTFRVFAQFEDQDQRLVNCAVAPGCVMTIGEPGTMSFAGTPLDLAPVPQRGRYYDPITESTEVSGELPYRTTTDHLGREVTLTLSLFTPAGDTATARPAIVLLRGDSFYAPADSPGFVDELAFARNLARRGYVVAAVDYRRRIGEPRSDATTLAAALDAYDDATAAVAWLADHAADLGIDPAAIVATGRLDSGTTALNLAYLPGQQGPATSSVAAAVPVDGDVVGDPIPEAGEPPVRAFYHPFSTPEPRDRVADTCGAAEAVGLSCEVETVDVVSDDLGSIVTEIQQKVAEGTAAFVADEVLAGLGYFAVEADAGGPYEVVEGSSVMLDGSHSTGRDLTYAWSPLGRLDDPTVPQPTLVGVDDGTEPVTLRVTNSSGISATADASVTTLNAAPRVEAVELTTAPPALTVDLRASISDPGRADTHTATVDWGDNSRSDATVGQGFGAATALASHTYTGPGRYLVGVSAEDDDGGLATSTTTVVVGCTVVGSDGNEALVGGDGDDVICGFAGNDLLVGGPGHDHLLGGTGNDLLVGSAGDDTMTGGAGTDWALGGPGTDRCSAERRLSCTRS